MEEIEPADSSIPTRIDLVVSIPIVVAFDECQTRIWRRPAMPAAPVVPAIVQARPVVREEATTASPRRRQLLACLGMVVAVAIVQLVWLIEEPTRASTTSSPEPARPAARPPRPEYEPPAISFPEVESGFEVAPPPVEAPAPPDPANAPLLSAPLPEPDLEPPS